MTKNNLLLIIKEEILTILVKYVPMHLLFLGHVETLVFMSQFAVCGNEGQSLGEGHGGDSAGVAISTDY